MKKRKGLFRAGAILLTAGLAGGGLAKQATLPQNPYAVTASALSGTAYGNGLYYEVTWYDTVTITDCEASATTIVVPETIAGYPVTGIGESAFKGCTALTSIELPDSIVAIGANAFSDCGKLASPIALPNLHTIGEGAFSECWSLPAFTVPKGVTTIEPFTFFDCFALQSLVLPEGLTTLGNQSLASCKVLSSLTLPQTLTTIGDGALLGCSALTSILIPENVTSIGLCAFSNMAGLTSMKVAIGNTVYHSRNQCVIDTANKQIVSGCQTSIIPTDGSVTRIGIGAFYACLTLKELVIPRAVTSIGAHAFETCAAMTAITLPSTLTTIEEYAFADCIKLSSIAIPNSVTKIGGYLFWNCKALSAVVLPKNMTSIPEYMFYFCKNLSSITIPSSVTSIGNSAFSCCEKLTSISIPSRVTSIGERVFSSCPSLTAIHIPASVASIGGALTAYSSAVTSITVAQTNRYYHSVDNCLIDTAAKRLLCGCPTSVIPTDGSVTSIAAYAMGGLTGLQSIRIPASITSIGRYAFYSCTDLSDVYYDGSVADWAAMEIGEENKPLTSATISYDYIPLSFTGHPMSVLATYGTTATFSVDAVGNGLVYQWQYTKNNGASWGNLTGETSDTYSVKAVSARNGFIYRCRVTDIHGDKKFSKQAKLIVQTKAAITKQPSPVTALRDSFATFTVGARGDGLVYQWQYTKNNGASWGNLTGETSASYSVKAVNARNGFCYRCRVTDQYGNKAFTKKVKLTVVSTATIIAQPKSVTAAAGKSATFTVDAVGKGLTYRWQFSRNDGTTWSNLNVNTTSYTVQATGARDGYCYRCIVKDQDGNTVISSVATLTVT